MRKIKFNYSKKEMAHKGVYKITTLHDSKCYVGSTFGKKGFYLRWHVHLNNLNKGKHGNSHLQNVYNKYGLENFQFEILEVCDESLKKVRERELYWIVKLDSYINGYNQTLETLNKERCLKHAKACEKQVFQYSLDGLFLRSWKSITKANATHGKGIWYSKGFLWSNTKHKNVPKYEGHTNSKKVLVYNRFTGNFIGQFRSISEACKYLKLSCSNVSISMKNNSFIKDFIFKDFKKEYPLKIQVKTRKEGAQYFTKLIGKTETLYFKRLADLAKFLKVSAGRLTPKIKKGTILKSNVTSKEYIANFITQEEFLKIQTNGSTI